MKILSIVALVLGLSYALSDVSADTSIAVASTEHKDVHEHFQAKATEMSQRHQREMNGVVNKNSQESMAAHNKTMKEWKEWRAAYLEIPGHTVNDPAFKAKQRETQATINKGMFANSGADSRKELGELDLKHQKERDALQAEYDQALAKHNAEKSK